MKVYGTALALLALGKYHIHYYPGQLLRATKNSIVLLKNARVLRRLFCDVCFATCVLRRVFCDVCFVCSTRKTCEASWNFTGHKHRDSIFLYLIQIYISGNRNQQKLTFHRQYRCKLYNFLGF